ncbi:MAG: hypothetical protein JWQ73_4358 [Variovorax sp.]|nr:hypothetical protein [Variovorax sp.]
MAYSLTFKESGTTRMTTIKQYDYLNRLTNIDSGSGVGPSLMVITLPIRGLTSSGRMAVIGFTGMTHSAR